MLMSEESDNEKRYDVFPALDGRALSGDFFDNPIIYFLLIDRFCNSNPGRAAYYGRVFDTGQIGSFHGGNLEGITARLKEGWFSRLGVNAIWISAPFEQIHGWVPSAGNEFRYEPYHGYWTLDFTALDKNFGSSSDLSDLINVAHGLDIKIIFDVMLSHPGYPDLRTFNMFLPNSVKSGWQNATPENYNSYFDFESAAIQNWWGKEWVRANFPGYPQMGEDELTGLMFNLPKFLTESDKPVSLPEFLAEKADSATTELPGTPVRGYLIKWLTDWVRQYGVDGFRCDSVKHVDLRCWKELKAAASRAFSEWKAENSVPTADSTKFWMTGEVFGNSIEHNAYYDNGFDNLINFHFQQEIKKIFGEVDMEDAYMRRLAFYRLDKLYTTYSIKLGRSANHNVLSYLSSHDTELFDRKKLIEGGTALMLAPGGIQIFYGDESARSAGPCTKSDPVQATRSDMNWEAIDEVVLQHWRLLGSFRSRHVAVARGAHQKLADDPYVFLRHDALSGDCVLIAMGESTMLDIVAPREFEEGQQLRDAYTGNLTGVVDGRIRLDIDVVMLLEKS